jgi:hypothetical protein
MDSENSAPYVPALAQAVTEKTSVREVVLEELGRETELALALGERIQNRAQSTSSVIALITSLVGVALSASPTLASKLNDRDTTRWTSYAVAVCLAVSLTASLVAAWPISIRQLRPQWLLGLTTGEEARTMIRRDSAPARRLDEILVADRISRFSSLVKANRIHGIALAASTVFLLLSIIATSALSIMLIDRG